ncbi:MAG: Stk1 family PASTA domain-containing Ser/Thr kinase [Actinobacteria bacterium]|nr:Stk1 family PASTA domain-containing Ser/Thr kinase [Actinomycetota bacterium]
MADLTGEIIDGRYQLMRIIDSGGMATIYSALDLRLDRQVAVKIMHPHLAHDENYVERFIREAKAAAAISHPNIVAIQDQGWNQGGVPAVFIVMELVEGATLRQYLNQQGRLPLTELLPIIKPVLSALAAAHRLGIVHRDIKPENILISKDGRVKIADFGLARGSIIGQTMTAESSVVLGSVSYLAPEQVERGVADARSDVYSTGVMFFEALTGEKPFSGDDPVQVALKHVKERVPRLSQMMTEVLPALDDLIYLATSSNPDERPIDAGDFLNKIRSLALDTDGKADASGKSQMSLELDLPPRNAEPVKEKPISENQNESGEEVSRPAKRKLSKRVKRNRTIAVAIVIAIIAATWYIVIGPGTRIEIPSVAGMTITQASNALTPLGVSIEIREKEFSEDIAEGKVIRSDPAGGDKVAEGGTVYLYVSQGKERYTVPTISGLTPEEATELIQDNNLRVGAVSSKFSPDVEAGKIITQEPAASARVMRDSLVNFVVSKGIESMAVNNYTGKSGEQALNELTAAGFDVEVEYRYSETEAPDFVIAQLPEPSGDLPKGSKIILIVSQGTEFIKIPNLISKPTDEAKKLLEDAGLIVKVDPSGKNAIKRVYAIDPKVDSKVKRGTTVTISVR